MMTNFKMEEINSCVQKAVKADKIILRPRGSLGIWVALLLPTAVILSSLKTKNVSELYLSSAVYSFNLLLNFLLLICHVFKYKNFGVTKRLNIFFFVPIIVTAALYRHFLNLDYSQCLYFAVANAIIYFEGILFIFKAFPKTFTFGEGNIIIQGFSLFVYSLFLRLHDIIKKGVPKGEQDISTVILQLTFSWIILFCVAPYVKAGLRQVASVYILAFGMLGFIYFSVFGVLKNDLFLWVWSFLTKSERIGIIILWFICSATAVVIVQHQINKKKKSNTILRKYFHVLAVIVFLSGILLDVNLIYFSSGCVFALFIVLEVFRILKLPPLYDFLQEGFKAYCDEKDSGNVAITPICLLVGMSLPLWLHPSKTISTETQLQYLSGVLSVGIGDTFASIGGKLLGKHKLKGSYKTIEGTVFCILSQIIFVQILISFGCLQNVSRVLVKGLTAIFVTSLVEALTDQIDNIVLPLVMYILLMF